MAIKITENGVVNYENSPDVNRKLFPNLNKCGKEIDKLEEEINGKAPAVFSTTSGSIASFDNGADDMSMRSCVVTIEPIQGGEGDPSPENVRPISGRTGLSIYHSGTDMSDPTTLTVNWETEAGTVYGGTLDVVSGKLTVDHIYIALPIINGTAVSGSVRRWYTPLFPEYRALVACDSLKSSEIYAPTNLDCAFLANDRIIITPSWGQEITTVEEFNTLLSDHPVNMVIRTAAHTEIQLTPHEVRTLLGVNNIWSDAGDVSVDYPADTKTYIDDLSITTVEVSGQTPTITAEENTRYICGEVTSLSFTPCEKGICDVRFTAASISTVLTLPETVKLPEWFDASLLEANTTYEINIVDGVYGVVMSWA